MIEIPTIVTDGLSQLATGLLLLAVTALGVRTSLREVASIGWRPICLLAGETVFLFYRKDLFDKYNLEVPKTYAEMLNTAAFFDENEDRVDGMSFRVRLGWEFTYTWSIFMFPFGGQMMDPVTGKPNMNIPGNAYSLSYMKELAKHAPVGVESFSFPEAWDAFMLGKTAMMVEASAAAPEIENPKKSIVAGKVGYSPIHKGPAGAFSGVWGWGLGVTEESKNKDAAWAFVMYMTSKGMQDDYLKNGGIPSRSSSLENTSSSSPVLFVFFFIYFSYTHLTLPTKA